MSNNGANTPSRYCFDQLIGRGGMGEVWLGRSILAGGLSRTVAIKRIISKHAHDEQMREQFLIEAQASLGLSHANIVFVFDYLEIDDRDCLVMEWVQGVNAAELLSQLRVSDPWPVPPKLATYIGVCILSALEYTHNLQANSLLGSGLIHRDVSPQNILISTQGEVKLSDFGVARLSNAATTIGGPKGKIAYMAPEQFHRKHDKRVDLYSVGAVLFEMLTGHRYQFFGGELSETGEDDFIKNAMLQRNITPGLGTVVARLLRQRPDRRYADAKEALAQLRYALPFDEPQAQAELGALASKAYFVLQDRRPTKLQPVLTNSQAELASSIIAHQLLDDTARPNQVATEKNTFSTVPSSQITAPDTQDLNSSTENDIGKHSWVFLGGLGASGTVALMLALQQGLFDRSPVHEPITQSQQLAKQLSAQDPGHERGSSANADPQMSRAEFAQDIEKARRASLKQLKQALNEEDKPWSQIEGLVAFNLRVRPDEQRRIDTSWLSACDSQDQLTSSCQVARSLLSIQSPEQTPKFIDATDPPSHDAKVLLERAINTLSNKHQKDSEIALARLLATALVKAKLHALNTAVLKTKKLPFSARRPVPGVYTQSGWHAGVQSALCHESERYTAPEWKQLHHASLGHSGDPPAPFITLYQTKRDLAWSSFFNNLEILRPNNLQAMKRLLGAPKNSAQRTLELLETESSLRVDECPEQTRGDVETGWLSTEFGRSLTKVFDCSPRNISNSPKWRRFLKSQTHALALLESSRESEKAQSQARRELATISAEIPKLSDNDFKGGAKLHRILRFPTDQAREWAALSNTTTLRESWCSQVYAPFRSHFASRYPFSKKSSIDVDLRKFKQFFHPKRGTLWAFVRQHKGLLTQRTGEFINSPKAPAKSQMLGPKALEFLNGAWLLARAMYPRQAERVKLSLTVELPEDGQHERASWLFGSTTLDLPAGQNLPKRLSWPLDFGSGATTLAFHRSADPFPLETKAGPGTWSLFRLLDQGYLLSDRGRQFTMLWSDSSNQRQGKLRFRILHEPSPFFGERGHRTRLLHSFAISPPAIPIEGTKECKGD